MAGDGWEAEKMKRHFFTVPSWPGVATKALEGQSLSKFICLHSEGSGFSNGLKG